MSEAELEVIREQYVAINEADWERSIALWAEDAVLDIPSGLRTGVFKGREAVVSWFADWFTTFAPGASFELREISELEDGSILAVSEHRATGRGSGVEVKTDVVWRYFVEDGKIVHQIGHDDRDQAVAAASAA